MQITLASALAGAAFLYYSDMLGTFDTRICLKVFNLWSSFCSSIHRVKQRTILVALSFGDLSVGGLDVKNCEVSIKKVGGGLISGAGVTCRVSVVKSQ